MNYWEKDNPHHYSAIVNGKHRIKALTYTDLKRKASIVANNDYNSFDTMLISITPENGKPWQLTAGRINKKYPNNTIIRGKWW